MAESPGCDGGEAHLLRWPWIHGAVALALTALVAVLDIIKPMEGSLSTFYLLPGLYAAWTLRGLMELVVYGTVAATVFLVPWLTEPESAREGFFDFNRCIGVLVGGFMVFLMGERRRSATALQKAKDELEDRVAARTAELQEAIRSLSQEISERTRAEEELRQAQKMEAIGRMAGGMAHDFNNLLTVIIGHSSVLKEKLPLRSPERQGSAEIFHAGERAAQLVRQLLDFSRKQFLQPTVLNLNQVVLGMRDLLGRLLPENIHIGTDLDPALAPIKADRGRLEQVLMNLAANARDAMPEGGEFHLATKQCSPEGAVNGRQGQVCLTVRDSGRGMTEPELQHIFEPFFTTKEVGKGTGLGLASVFGTIKQSGGNITVASVVGRGTTFTILFPSGAGLVVPAPAQEENPGDIPRGHETILLVEDEAALRALGSKVLQRAGYQVLEARHGLEALEMVKRHTGPLHLVVTDVVMPEMGGPAMANILRRSCADLKVLFISGYAGSKLAGKNGLSPNTVLLDKPFTPRALACKVREVLDHR